MSFEIVKLTETDFEIVSTCEAYDERPIREKLEDTEYEINKDRKVVSNFTKMRLITSMEKDANPTFMQRKDSTGEKRFTPVSQKAVKLMYKIGDKLHNGHGNEKSSLTAEEAFRNKVVVVDTDYMIVPNPY